MTQHQLCSGCKPVLQEAARRVFWLNEENSQLRKRIDQLANGSAKVVDALEEAIALAGKLKSRGALTDEEVTLLAVAVEPCVPISENLAAGIDQLRRGKQWGKKAKPNS